MKKIFILLIGLISTIAFSKVILPNFFANNMVLQRNSEVKIWGWASPKEEITLTTSWDGKEYKTVGSPQATWQLHINTPKEGGPYEIKIKGYNEVLLKDILIGEVWLCSGQSNMEMNAGWGIKNGDEEVKNANYPNIRFFNVEKTTATSPQINTEGNWVACTPESMKYTSAAGYFFARKLYKELNVPIGIIVSAWGGSPAAIWTPEDKINVPAVAEDLKRFTTSEYCPVELGRAYNSMIAPLVGYKIKGILWYQGESNVGSKDYTTIMTTLINSWRDLWKEQLPFYFAQIAPYGKADEVGDWAAETRYQQLLVTQKVSNTKMILTSDICTIDDIHPKNKQEVGARFANIALEDTYKKNIGLVYSPEYTSAQVNNGKVFLTFKYSEGLHFTAKKSKLFEIAGEDGKFYVANAEVKNDKIELTSNKVKKPKKVRYAWSNIALPDVFNKANLPLSSFKTDF